MFIFCFTPHWSWFLSEITNKNNYIYQDFEHLWYYYYNYTIINYPFSASRFEALTSCKDLALVFNDLHKIQLIDGPEETCHLLGLTSALNALNLGEAAKGRISSADIIDIYVGAALRIKTSFPNILHSIQRLVLFLLWFTQSVLILIWFLRYYLGLAQLYSTNSYDSVPKRLQWIFTPYGYKFFISHKFKEIKSNRLPFSSLGNSVDPLAIQIKVSCALWKSLSVLTLGIFFDKL